MRTSTDVRRGFTVVELLTVVAIIAILASVIFPVATAVRGNARRTQAISNLRQIAQSLGQYKLDERAFPPALGEYLLPGDARARSPLIPDYLQDRGALRGHGALEPDDPDDVAVPYLREDLVVPLNSDQSVLARYGISQVRPDDLKVQTAGFQRGNMVDGFWALRFPVNGDFAYELRYSRYRPAEPSDPDYLRQLRFRDPPESTVVTWVSQYRSPKWNNPEWRQAFEQRLSSGNIQGDEGLGEDLVLFLNGSVQRFPAIQVIREGWRIRPRE